MLGCRKTKESEREKRVEGKEEWLKRERKKVGKECRIVRPADGLQEIIKVMDSGRINVPRN